MLNSITTGNPYLDLIIITFMPFLELRASIPYGLIKLGMQKWFIVFLICVIANIILGFIIYFFAEGLVVVLRKIPFFGKYYHSHIERTQHKIHKSIEKYGEWGVAIFIGIPLPGTGVYSGAIASYLLGLEFKKFAVACILGVLIAGIIVTGVMLTGNSVFGIFLKV